jgi:hypothetical protein
MLRVLTFWFSACLALALVVTTAMPTSAEIPRKINYQGRLLDNVTGEPLVGSHDMAFRIFDAATDGTELWAESHVVVADSAGVVSVILGDTDPVDVTFDGPMWLEVEVMGEVLAPRPELVSVPYAFRAHEADSLGGHGAAEFVLKGEISSITVDMIVGGAGSGLDADLVDGLNGDAFADSGHAHDDRYYTQDSLSTPGAVNEAGNPVDWTKLKGVPAGFADGTDDVGEAADGYSLDADDGDPVDALYVAADGKVGIGTTAPGEKLEVAGTIRAQGFDLPADSAYAYVLTSDSSGVGTWQAPLADGHSLDSPSGSYTDVVYVDDSGDVGIGTDDPSGALEIYGDENSQVILTIKNPNTGSASGERVSFSDEHGDICAIVAHDDDSSYPNQLRIFNNRPDGTMALMGAPVGINQSNPEERLDVGGTVKMTGFKLPTDAVEGHVLTSDGAGTGTWQTPAVGGGHSLDAADGDPVDALFVDNEGDVGIGTTYATVKLHIREDTNDPLEVRIQNLDTGPQSAERIIFGDENGDAAMITTYDDGALQLASTMEIANSRPGGTIQLRTEGQTVAYVTKKGLGLTYTAPKKKLHIYESGAGLKYGMKLENFSSSGATGILFKVDGGMEDRGKGGIVYERTDTWNRGDFHILQDYHTDSTAADLSDAVVTIKNDGEVGIGITTPQSNLHVHESGLYGCYSTLTTSGTGGGPGNGLVMGISNSGLALISNKENNDIQFETIGNTAMVLTADNRLCVGGLTSFEDELHIHNLSNETSTLRLTNAGVGHLTSDGLEIQETNTGVASVINRENQPLKLGANGNVYLDIEPNGGIGIGTESPVGNFHLHESVGGSCSMKLTNLGTGAGSSDGLYLSMSSGGDVYLVNREDGPIYFGAGNLVFGAIDPEVRLGVGTTIPRHLLHLNAGSSDSCVMQMTGGTAGIGAGDGLLAGLDLSGNAFVLNQENKNLALGTNGLSRLYVASDGRVGLGEASPSSLLDLESGDPYLELNSTGAEAGLRLKKNESLKWQLGWNEGSGYFYFWSGGGAGTSLVIEDATGEVGIGTSSPGYDLDVAGICHASSFPTSSDERFKENVEQLSGVLDRLARVRGVAFDWNERYEALGRSTGHREIGVIAQEVEAVFPELVTTWGDEDYRAVDYGRLTGVLIEAVRELRAENEDLSRRVEALEAGSR